MIFLFDINWYDFYKDYIWLFEVRFGNYVNNKIVIKKVHVFFNVTVYLLFVLLLSPTL